MKTVLVALVISLLAAAPSLANSDETHFAKTVIETSEARVTLMLEPRAQACAQKPPTTEVSEGGSSFIFDSEPAEK